MPDVTLPFTLTNGTSADADQVMADFNALRTAVNDLDGDNLSAATAALLGLSQAGTVRGGKSVIATSETRTNGAYGVLTTPDRVSGVVLPTDGLLIVSYKALWKESVAGSAYAAIFLGAVQLLPLENTGAGGVASNTGMISSGGASVANRFGTLRSSPDRLLSSQTTADAAVGATGQVADSGSIEIEAAAGTYDVSVQFGSSSGTVTVKNRKLRVRALAF